MSSVRVTPFIKSYGYIELYYLIVFDREEFIDKLVEIRDDLFYNNIKYQYIQIEPSYVRFKFFELDSNELTLLQLKYL